ncbi:low affinity immunoglobulin gamma Fc region receptor III-B-like [Salarias fasciatus]|uniref:low affinity immunoglobulin gamma Fc region receptor III-B-like n=1 Tax=Salarias fasciatus TaxID=181472 RepID=UPI001176A51C|nr:low affinity immunoglobulin gamma Fc region receptor III-A [Salarias fasciatus]
MLPEFPFLTNRETIMDKVIAFLILSALPQLQTVASLRAVISVVPQTSRIFTGESVRLTCGVPDDQGTVWDYQWFRESEQLPQTGPSFSLWKAKIQESGNFSCEGMRDTWRGKRYTLRSLPVEIKVDGGLAILQVLPHPGLVAKSMSMTCRVRRNPPVHEIILYKDGIEVQRERGLNPQILLTSLRPEDEGMYSCRASWDVKGRTISVISAPTYVQIPGTPTTELPPQNVENQQPVSPASVPQSSAPPATPPITIQPITTQYTQEPEGSRKFYEESGDFSEESGDFSEESGSGDLSGASSGLTPDFVDFP